MTITALVEKPIHGLSLHIKTSNHNILFDLGSDRSLFENSKKKNIDLSKIDTVIISHGHIDHGGALEAFLKINKTAKIYVQRKAFENHYSSFLFFKINVGLNKKLKDHSQIVLLDGNYRIDNELFLFTVSETSNCYSEANDALYTSTGRDDFSHEHHLLISDKSNLLIHGCGHTGIVNILAKVSEYEYMPDLCIGGYHLFNPLTRKTVSYKLLDKIAKKLKKYNIKFYTCHCTGKVAFRYLSNKLTNLSYLSCGDSINI